MHQIVFLDRDSLIANIRQPAFAHRWCDYPATSPDEVVDRLRGATIAITNKVPLRADAIAQLPDLKMIAVAATGTDNVDLAACRARGIVVANIRNYSLVSVPEHCFALILAVRRNLRAYVADVEAGRWERSTRFCLLDHPIGDLAGSRLGIVGYGALGRRVAQIGRAFGMEIAVAVLEEIRHSGRRADRCRARPAAAAGCPSCRRPTARGQHRAGAPRMTTPEVPLSRIAGEGGAHCAAMGG